MSKNIWYVIGERDDTSPFGYSQITPKGQYFTSLKDARKALKEHQKLENKYGWNQEIVIFERTCKVIK